MAKISQLPDTDPATLDGTEQVLIVQAGATKKTKLNTLLPAIEPLADTVAAEADPDGAWTTRTTPDGTVRIAKLADAYGNRIDLQLAAAQATIATLQSQIAVLMPSPARTRLKASLYDGAPRRVMAADPLAVSAPITTSSIAGGTTVSYKDARIGRIGGKMAVGTGFPYRDYLFPYTTHYSASPAGNGGLGQVGGQTQAWEFMLSNAARFEVLSLGTGGLMPFAIEIDGVATNDSGYSRGLNGSGSGYYTLVQLPVSATPQRIRLIGNGWQFGGVIIPAGATLAAVAAPARPSSLVFMGDSITEGSVSTHPSKMWDQQCAYRLGIKNPIGSGVGGSGYLQSLGRNGTSQRQAGYNDYNFVERINDILQAIDGGPPDGCVIAGGINDYGYYTASQIQTQAVTLFQQLRTSAPDMSIVVLGPFCGYGGYAAAPASFLAAAAAIQSATQQVARCDFVDVSGWVTPANQDQIFNANVNGPHPIDSGHAIYGQLAAEAISKIYASY